MGRARSIRSALVALLLAPSPAQAQGASVYPHGGCILARAGAGVAAPCDDGSAVFYAPAGLAFRESTASLGAIVAATGSEFTFDDPDRGRFESIQDPIALPHLWIGWRAGRRLASGLGAWAPYGLRTRWPLEFEGRYVGYDNRLATIYIQPTLAFQVVPDRLAIGGGLAVVHGTIELRQRIDLAATAIPRTTIPFSAIGVPPGTDFADSGLEARAWTATLHVGILAHLSRRWSLGARYLLAARLADDAGAATFRQVPTGIVLPPGNPLGLPPGTPLDATLAPLFAPGGPLGRQRLAATLTLPDLFVTGLRYAATPRLALVADYQWTGWSTFDRVPLDFERASDQELILSFENTSGVRIAVDYDAPGAWTARAGFAFTGAATPDLTVTPLLPEGRRISLTGGFAYRLGIRIRADVGLELVLQEDRRGRVRPRTGRERVAEALNVGVYEGRALLIGATLVYGAGGR